MNKELSYPRNKIQIALLEGVHLSAVNRLAEHGYQVKNIPRSVAGDELLEMIPDLHVLGVRSKTKITAAHLEAGKKLLAIGCFGVGTNHVDLEAARSVGVPVFNAPYGNTRSVAELTLCSLLTLSRRVGDSNQLMHSGRWKKSAKGMHEVRGKTLGIVGYGHIGQQVAIMAEAIGLSVIFYDKVAKLPLGNSHQVDRLEDLLKQSDFITLHVPADPSGRALIGTDELQRMKKGSYLVNMSRGTLVDFAALRAALEGGTIGGAAIDVYPKEPQTNDEPFDCGLMGVPNVLLTPHLGGSTEEAQENIGVEVSGKFIRYVDGGITMSAVNFPEVDLPESANSHRVLNIHRNEPGVLREVNRIISELGANINAQYLNTLKDIGYLIMDVDKELSAEVKQKIAALPTSIKTRVLY